MKFISLLSKNVWFFQRQTPCVVVLACRQFSRRSVPQSPEVNRRKQELVSSVSNNNDLVSAPLLASVQNRLAALNYEVDLGLGPVVEQSNDLLLEAIVKAVDVKQLKSLIGINYRQMNGTHVSNCLLSLANIAKHCPQTDTFHLDVLGSQEFHLLANRTLKVVRHMEPEEALQSLLSLHSLGISVDTVLVQSLLQMVRFSINEFSLTELYRLMRWMKTLSKQKSSPTTPLLQAIHLALPYAIKHRIAHKQMNFNSPIELLRCIEAIAFFGSDQFLNDTELLCTCLQHTNKIVNKLSPIQAVNLFSYMCNIHTTDSECRRLSRLILSRCIEKMSSTEQTILQQLPSLPLINALDQMRANTHSFDRQLWMVINELANTSEKQFTFRDQCSILLHNWHLKCVNYKLMTHFAQLLENNDPKLLRHLSPISLINLWRIFTLPSDRKQINVDWNLICKNIISSPIFEHETDKLQVNYWHFLLSSLILGVHIDQKLIIEWLCKHLQPALEASVINSKRHVFLKTITFIYQGLLLDKKLNLEEETCTTIRNKLDPFVQEYKALLQNELQNFHSNQMLDKMQLMLSRRLDGQYILSKNVITSDGLLVNLLAQPHHNTDHCYGVMLFNHQHYCREPHILDGVSWFQLKMLSHNNIYPIVIDLLKYNSMTEPEKEQYLVNMLYHRSSSQPLDNYSLFV